MKLLQSFVAVGAAACVTSAFAQATVKPDGQWHAAATLGASHVGGNAKASSLSLAGDALKLTAIDRWAVYGNMINAKAAGNRTADLARLGTRYDRNIDVNWFGFGSGELERNKLANLDARLWAGGGVGRHLIRNDTTTFDVFGGLGYAYDDYGTAAFIADRTRSTYGRIEGLLGEESTHKLTANTNFKQRFIIYPNLSDRGEFRAAFDAGLSVAMSTRLALTLTLGARYNSDPGTGLKNTDTVFITGITYKYD